MNSRNIQKTKILLCLPLVVLLFAFSVVLFANWVTLNFHQILQNQVYRSRQLTAQELTQLQASYHWRSMINLRGKQPAASWYQEEIQTAASLHMRHYDFFLPAHGLPSWKELTALVNTLQRAPKPILLHCREGADRTGLAAVLTLLLAGKSKQEVERQITWKYNVLSPHTIGYQVLQNYYVWLRQQHAEFGKQNFLRWVQQKPTLVPQAGWYFGLSSEFN